MNSDGNTDSLTIRTTELAPANSTLTKDPMLGMPSPASLPEELLRHARPEPRDPGRYQIIAEHGRGGLGRVTRVHDRELGRDVAIKELLSRDHLREVRFLREALITARLEHPGIVPVHEAGRWPDGTPFYAMKLVSGRPLRELIVERTRVEDRIGLLHHVIAVTDAIAYAHDRNIIHRDLKPANIIVGDFGETVVIDWGLAKDISTVDPVTEGGGPFCTTSNDGLTEAGTILGTPAYMAPEQLAGEPVDQRADVYAIGVMLWQLCTVQKLSSVEPELRPRTLRRGGIDEDLVAIIAKALDLEPARRYRDAGALAADLKAFKSGARIAARRYSLLAMLAHWIRRHRALALSAAAVAMVAVAGVAIYVRNITAERDRADAALDRVEATRNDLAREHAELTLKHAQLLLATDPSAALDTLETYQGNDRDRASQVRAEAIGRGVAVVRAVPHTDNVVWATGMPDGAIISLSADGTIARTLADRTSTVLARDATRWLVHSYAASHHLLAYFCGADTLCMLDVLRGEQLAVPPEFHDVDLVRVAHSPSGDRIALLSRDGRLQVFDVSVPTRPRKRFEATTDHGVIVHFAGEDTVVVRAVDAIQLARAPGKLQTLRLPGVAVWDVSEDSMVATAQGQVLLVEINPLAVTTRETVCRDSISGLRLMPQQRLVAYACQEGTVGTWDPQRRTVASRTHLDGHADLVAVSAAGDYLLAAGGNGSLTVIDLSTDLVTSYSGHGFRLTAISPPTTEYPFFISGDVRGGLRAWSPPARLARVVASLPAARFSAAIFTGPAATLVATTLDRTLAVFSTSQGVQVAEPHIGQALRIAGAADGDSVAMYGSSDLVELWSSRARSRTQVVDTHHGAVSHLEFVGDTKEFITAGQDGRIVRWMPDGEPRMIARLAQPIATFALAPATQAAVVSTTDGALWRIADDGRPLLLKAGGVRAIRMQVLADAATVCVGYADGAAIVVDTRSWRQRSLLKAAEAIRDIAVTPDNRTIAIAANDGIIYIGSRDGGSWLDEGTTWVALTARARRIALTADGLLVAVCTDGTVRLWSSARRTWLCLPTGTVAPVTVVVTPDGKAGAALDNMGRIIWIDLEAVRKVIENAH